jgi:hypothetical protein
MEEMTQPTATLQLPPTAGDTVNLQTPRREEEKCIEEELCDSDEEDEIKIMDEFVSKLREQTLLQSLLHQQLDESETKERVLKLEYRNGKRMLVVILPDLQTVDLFVDTAKSTRWIDEMLKAPHQLQGMLFYLAKKVPDEYKSVGEQRKLLIKDPIVLNTEQTIALGRVCNINDSGMERLKSFVRNVGKVRFEEKGNTLKEIEKEVGIPRTKDSVSFNTYLHEWSSAKGKEKRKQKLSTIGMLMRIVRYWPTWTCT